MASIQPRTSPVKFARSSGDRKVAQRLISAGLELLVWGGSLSLGFAEQNADARAIYLTDQLADFAGVMEANDAKKYPAKGDDLAAWKRQCILGCK